MKDFFERLNTVGQPKRNDIIEKDYQLHRLLFQISRNNYLRSNLIFKGGTCLIKGYLGYYRFSEDLDFTWNDNTIWKDRGRTEIKRSCSIEISELVKQFKIISDNLGFDFYGDKNNVNEVHISSGGRMVLFFLGYRSDILNLPTRIKIEINFVENVIYPTKVKTLQSYIDKIESEEIRFLFEPLWREYNKIIKFSCYDPREIFIEKCRASLTRKVFKLRDMIDIYYMDKNFDYKIPEYNKEIKEKIGFMLDLYKRYRENIRLLHGDTEKLSNNEELKLMLVQPPKDLNTRFIQFIGQLEDIRTFFSES